MSVHQWNELDRATLTELLPRATVMISIGAVEQHGPHLPTGADSMISQHLCTQAAHRAAASGAEIVLTPPLWFGASDHHLRFGGTLSLQAATLLAVLTDLITSMARAGATRVLMVNGHGGNSGLCHAAAAAVSAHHELDVAHVDYWTLIAGQHPDLPVPGHAGAFETAVLTALRPELVQAAPNRPEPPVDPDSDLTVHSTRAWRAIDGWTDHPDRASTELGEKIIEDIVRALSQTLVDWSHRP